jgi:adenosylmethionine-8-amino-7-oxononanoate aminotransferase
MSNQADFATAVHHRDRVGRAFIYLLLPIADVVDARDDLSRDLRPALFERGLICRADDGGDPVIQISPPLVAGQAEFDEIVGILGEVLEEAGQRLVGQPAPA